MTPRSYWALALFGWIALAGCSSPSEPEEQDRDVLFQVSTLEALLEGRYEGVMTYNEVKAHGTFGLGTFEALDGEMIALDDGIYQVKADGVAYRVDDAMTTPFAAVTFFEADAVASFEAAMDCAQLEAGIDRLLPSEAIPYAIKVEGQFTSVTTRSVARQEKPYPGLVEALAEQVEFRLEEVAGTMVGFRLPGYMEGANVVGYHFHFLTADRRAGGHVLGCQSERVEVSLDDIGGWYLALPGDEAASSVSARGT